MPLDPTPLDRPTPTDVATSEGWMLLAIAALLGTVAIAMPESLPDLVVSSSGGTTAAPCFG